MDFIIRWTGKLLKNLKTPFFQDIQNSFQWATGIGLEPHQNFFRKKIPINTVTRVVQSFGRNGPLLAGWLSDGKKFFLNLAQTHDEQMLKISRRLLDLYLIYYWLTDFSPLVWSLLTKSVPKQEALNLWRGKLFHFFQILYYHIHPKVIVISIVDLQKINNFAKFGGCCSKNAPAMPLRSLKWSRTWQAYFFNYHFKMWQKVEIA